jgi:hypothetical protein
MNRRQEREEKSIETICLIGEKVHEPEFDEQDDRNDIPLASGAGMMAGVVTVASCDLF